MLALQDHGSVSGNSGLGLGLFINGTADHHANDFSDLGGSGLTNTHVLAVTHNGDAGGNTLQLVHSVGDVDDTNAGSLQLADESKQVVNLCIGQNRRRLVQNQDLGIIKGERLSDLNHLLLCNRQGSDFGLGVDSQVETVQQFLRTAVLLSLVQEQTLGRLTADEDIVCNGQMLHQIQLLVHDANTSVLCVLGSMDFDLLTEILNGTAVLGVDTGQNLHQCGLTGAVFTDQCHDFTAADLKLSIVQRVNTGEVLLNALHLQNCFAHSNITFLKSLSMYLHKPIKSRHIFRPVRKVLCESTVWFFWLVSHPTRAKRFAYVSCTKAWASIQ